MPLPGDEEWQVVRSVRMRLVQGLAYRKSCLVVEKQDEGESMRVFMGVCAMVLLATVALVGTGSGPMRANAPWGPGACGCR